MPATNNGLLTIAIADDHTMYRQAFAATINTWDNYKVTIQAGNGTELLEKINPQCLPDFVLVDLNMPVMNGYETIKIFKEKYPPVPVIVVSMFKSTEALMLLMQYNIQGYLNKNDDILQMKRAFAEIISAGTCFPDPALARIAKKNGYAAKNAPLTVHELRFLNLVCGNKTYKEIAGELRLPERRVEFLRENLFVRFDVKCRSGLARVAIEQGLAF